jgi:4-hydroxy-4-methyl-2-oxoglutarate aldolase
VARAEAAAVLDLTRQREAREETIRQRYAKGELGLDMNNMRPALAAKGLKYI